MPAGTVGFEAVGEVEEDDVDDVLLPVLHQWTADQRKIRLLYLLGPRLEDHDGDAVAAQAAFLARHPTAFERVAVVGDDGWLAPAVKAVSLLVPGEARTFSTTELPAAKRWLAVGLSASGEPQS